MNDKDKIQKLMSAAKAFGYGKMPEHEQNELFTIGAFDLILINCSDQGRNFRLLEDVCKQYEDVKADSHFLKGYLYLIRRLVYSTGTTEMPSGMQKILEGNLADTTDLQEWYRVTC